MCGERIGQIREELTLKAKTRRMVSGDFINAMEEKLQWGREQGRTGWDSNWETISVDSFDLGDLFEKLDEEVAELRESMHAGNHLIRLEAADVANIAMMIADMAGALDDTPPPEPVREIVEIPR